ncbi:c-type cytochrome [Solimonas soli]|uniref:c-type cytochrome n=1 Tax=Solimonas soli TaxID=413479 RepID=UPI000486F237|nr:cytochrome c [Solimonas soli]
MKSANHVIARTLCAALLLALAGAAQAQADLTSGTIFSKGYGFEEKDGEALYKGICQGCHMPDAKGATGAGTYPALAANPRLAAKQYPLVLVVNGSRAMPGFGHSLSAEQIAAVVNYVRTHFGNAYTDVVTPAEVKVLLPTKPETGE